MFRKFRGKLFEDEDLKQRKIGELGPRNRHHAPSACFGVHSHAPRAFKNGGRNRLFLLLCWVKPTLLAQTQVETITINTNLPHSKILIQNCGS